MPHEQPDSLEPTDIFDGHPLTIKEDLTMTVPEPHTMVWAGRLESPTKFSEHEQQLKLFTLLGVDHSPTKPSEAGLETGIVRGIEIKLGTNPPKQFPVTGTCEIKIFFTHS
jgi:hypothetical protein